MKFNIFTAVLMGVAAASFQIHSKNSSTSSSVVLRVPAKCSDFLTTTIVPPKTTVIQTTTETLFATPHDSYKYRLASRRSDSTTTTRSATQMPPESQTAVNLETGYSGPSAYSDSSPPGSWGCENVTDASLSVRFMPTQTETFTYIVPTSTAKFRVGAFFMENFTVAYVDVRLDGRLFFDYSFKGPTARFEIGQNHQFKVDKLLSWTLGDGEFPPGTWGPEPVQFFSEQSSGLASLSFALFDDYPGIHAAGIHILVPSHDGLQAVKKMFLRCGSTICLEGWNNWYYHYPLGSRGKTPTTEDAYAPEDLSPVMLMVIPRTGYYPIPKVREIVIKELEMKFHNRKKIKQDIHDSTAEVIEQMAERLEHNEL